MRLSLLRRMSDEESAYERSRKQQKCPTASGGISARIEIRATHPGQEGRLPAANSDRWSWSTTWGVI